MNSNQSVHRQVLLRMWENYPRLWKTLIDFGVFMKYKTVKYEKLHNKVTLPSSTVIFVNSNENRGRALLINEGVTQKRLSDFWNRSVELYSPDLVIDVGVNYGECIFSTTYPGHTTIYGIEANHQLLKYINKSKAVHPNKEQITIINALASDKNNETKDFYIDQHWSGTSSASYMPSHNMIEKVSVRAITIDSLLQNQPSYKSVLFKIDVEGYEALVLDGMKEILTNCSFAIGFIEFNSEYISKSGIDIEEFFCFLQKHFTIYIFLEKDKLIQAGNIPYSKLLNIIGTTYIHTDFILVAGNDISEVKGLCNHV